MSWEPNSSETTTELAELKGKERSSLRVAVELMKVLTMAYRARIMQEEARVRLRREDFRAIVGKTELGLRNLQSGRKGRN